jgi:putative zinc finger protein
VTETHDAARLAAYAVGLLPDRDVADLTAHLTGCPECQAELNELRALDTALRETPPELFLDGPPENADWLLRRTLRNVSRERDDRQHTAARHRQRRRTVLVAAAAIILVALGAGAVGYVVHRPDTGAVLAAPTQAGPGARTLTGVNPASGARISTTLTPKPGWVGIDASIANLPAHERCMLVVTDHANNRFVVGSWTVPAPGEGERDYRVNAGAAVALADLATVTVENFDHQVLVSADNP